MSIAINSTILVLAGLSLTALLYLGPRRWIVEKITAALDLFGLYQLSYGKFFFDPLYFALVVWPLEIFARFCAWFDIAGYRSASRFIGIYSQIDWLITAAIAKRTDTVLRPGHGFGNFVIDDCTFNVIE